MADNSTTETGADQGSSGSQNESLLDDNQQHQSADEQQDTGSSDSQTQDSGQDSDEGRQTDTTQDESSDDDDGLAKFAKAQGFDPDNLTEGEKRALKLARDNQKSFHEERQRQSEEARKALEGVHQSDDEELSDAEVLANEVASIKAVQRLQDFYASNPDARDYDNEMGEILVEEEKTYGKEAARALARNMPRLLREAKARRGDNTSEAAREAGRREERERLRQKQEGSGETSSAQTQGTKTPKVTREWVANEYDNTNPEHVRMLDEALARNELY